MSGVKGTEARHVVAAAEKGLTMQVIPSWQRVGSERFCGSRIKAALGEESWRIDLG